MYIDKGSYNDEIEEYNYGNVLTSCDHNRVNSSSDGDADATVESFDHDSHEDESRFGNSDDATNMK